MRSSKSPAVGRESAGSRAVALGGAALGALVRRRADHRGELGVDQRLVERLGGGADALVNVGGFECLEELEQGRLVQGHRVAFL
jgi:hypothetical protein